MSIENKEKIKIEIKSLLKEFLDAPLSEFRPMQENSILSAITPSKKTLLIQKTGYGKSAVYFIASKFYSKNYQKITVIVSPLLSLMRNQIKIAQENKFLNIVTINHTQTAEKLHDIKKQIFFGEIDTLIISPERFFNEDFKENIFPTIKDKIGLFVIDEAHVLSQWGHDFRVSYSLVPKDIFPQLPKETSYLFTTATATEKVIEDLEEYLNIDEIITGDLIRENLNLYNLGKLSQEESIDWIVKNIQTIQGNGIIYTNTRPRADQFAHHLRERNVNAISYHGKSKQRKKIENMFLNNEYKVVVATNALGMGFDKPDIDFLIHMGMPVSLTEYYQQIGRAGRNIDSANCYSIFLPGDDEIIEYFITNQLTNEKYINSVKKVLNSVNEYPEDKEIIRQRSKIYNFKKFRDILQKLWKENYVKFHGQDEYSKINKLDYDLSLSKKIEQDRRKDFERVKEYIYTKDCLMRMLILTFRQNIDKNYKCNKCSNCININFNINKDSYITDGYNFDILKEEFDKATLGYDNASQMLLDEKLKEFRKQKAEQDSIELYHVLTNSEIIEIVKTNPKNLQELSQIKGFNYSKRYEKYGQDIIDLLNN